MVTSKAALIYTLLIDLRVKQCYCSAIPVHDCHFSFSQTHYKMVSFLKQSRHASSQVS